MSKQSLERGGMPQSDKGAWIFLLMVSLLWIGECSVQPVWSQVNDVRSGQVVAYDAAYIDTGVYHNITVTLSSAVSTIPTYVGVVISGFENYLSDEMSVTVTYSSAGTSSISLDLMVGSSTYIRQLNMFYLCSNGTDYEILHANYSMTGDLLSWTDSTVSRQQFFNNQTSSMPSGNIKFALSAFSGFQLTNTEGTENSLQVTTAVNDTTIEHTIITTEKNIVTLVEVTTIVSDTDSQSLGFASESSYIQPVPTTTEGLAMLDKLGASGILSIQNSYWFGISRFGFTMGGTRLYLLDNTDVTDHSTALSANEFTDYITIDLLYFAALDCSTLTPNESYYTDEMMCIAPADCNDAISDTNICRNCDAACDGCAGTTYLEINNCTACVAGNNRIHNVGTGQCECDQPNGYFDNGNAACELCSDHLQGCIECSVSTTCIDCSSEFDLTTDGTCECPTGTYAVTGVCLDFPGCIESNSIITGEYCQTCDDANNFEIDVANNSTCVCKVGYNNTNDPQVCEDTCGDSIAADGKCDDGNAVGGDGCSSSCFVEYGYVCTEEVVGGISTCIEETVITITYRYAKKTLEANQVVLAFEMEPENSFLAEQTFENSVNSDIPYESRSIRYDPSNSFIFITIDYGTTLEKQSYYVNFTFAGLEIYSQDVNIPVTINGINAQITYSSSHYSNSLIEMVSIGLGAAPLLVAITAAILNQKMIGIELILPIQAAFFCMSTLPASSPSAIAALWPLTFSNSYNILDSHDLTISYMMSNNMAKMHYSGQFILNYNIGFSLIALMILVFSITSSRLFYLQSEEKRLEAEDKENEEKDREENEYRLRKLKTKAEADEEGETVDTDKQVPKAEEIMDQLEDIRESIKNWKNFNSMLLDRFFSIFVVTSFMAVYFCFFLQTSNLTFTAEVYANSVNAGFFMVVYISIIAGLYAIIYDYKGDKVISFNCSKGKYAIFYICIFLGYILVAGTCIDTSAGVYMAVLFSILPFVLILYQCPYQNGRLNFQTIVALICQLPFLIFAMVSLILGMGDSSTEESSALVYAFAILGSIGLALILTIIRTIKTVDFKKLSFFEFTDSKKDNANDKKNKKNKIALIELDLQKDYDEYTDESVREALIERQKESQLDELEIMNREAQKKRKEEFMREINEEDEDDDMDEIDRIKIKLRKELDYKKQIGKIN